MAKLCCWNDKLHLKKVGDNMLYFISDTHFNHLNIIKYCDRPFKNIEEMNETIINNWNKTVKENDEIYHLGDLALGRKENFYNVAKRLNGKKYLIRGNHDRWSINTYEKFGFKILKNAPIILEKFKLLLSHTPTPDKQIPEGYINLHGHIHNKSLYDCIEKYNPSMYTITRHINVSCDVTDFTPISIEKLL